MEADDTEAGYEYENEEEVVAKTAFLLRVVLRRHIIRILHLLLLLLPLLMLHHHLKLLEHLKLLLSQIVHFVIALLVHIMKKRVYRLYQ